MRLSDCCDFYSGGTPEKHKAEYWKGNIPWFSPKDIKTFDLTSAQDFISESAVRESATRLIESGTILVVGRSGVLAHTLPVGIVRQRSAFNQDIKALAPKAGHDADFIALYLRARQQEVLGDGVKRGPTVHSLISNFLEALEVPNLPFPEQHRIAARLKAQLAEVETARQAAQTQLREIAHLAEAIILDSVHNHSVTEHSLGDVLIEVKHGIGMDWADYPVLGATRDGLAPAKEPPGKHAVKYKPVVPGTVFYNPMRILIGSIAMVDDDDEAGITSPDYVVLKGKPDVVDTRWFYYWLRSPLGVACINSLARGAVRERMLFNRLAEGSIGLPGFSVQQKAAQALKGLNPLRSSVETQLAEIERLPQRLLAQAFAPPTTQGNVT